MHAKGIVEELTASKLTLVVIASVLRARTTPGIASWILSGGRILFSVLLSWQSSASLICQGAAVPIYKVKRLQPVCSFKPASRRARIELQAIRALPIAIVLFPRSAQVHAGALAVG